jgi:uncharacterized membrane protein (TIGR02234 family)
MTGRPARTLQRSAQVLLVLGALGLWGASRLPWVEIRSFDGLGQPKTATLSGSAWSAALVPLAVLLLAAAIATLAVRGWPLRLLAVLVAVVSAGTAYLAISLWVIKDIAVRGADLAQIPVAALVGSARHYGGAAVTLAAAVGALLAAVLLMRCAATPRAGTVKYVAPAGRRAAVRSAEPSTEMSERMMWDALDEGSDPTEDPTDAAPGPAGPSRPGSDTEGR